MTIEEKAKAYDEAIERYKAKQEYESQRVHEFIEYLFPELKESKGEKIRKALIENFKFYGGDYLETSKWGKDDGLLVTDILAWLEKQGEQKPVTWNKEDEKMYTSIIDDAVQEAQLDTNQIDWLKSLKNRISYKPTGAQLASLEIACDRNDRVGFDLTQLLKDLKKL